MQRRLALAALVVLAGCGAVPFGSETGELSPSTPSISASPSPTVTSTVATCYTHQPLPDLHIENGRLHTPDAPTTISITVERVDNGTNESTVVLERAVTLQYREAGRVTEIPGWDDRYETDESHVLTVRDENRTAVTVTLDQLGGDQIFVDITQGGLTVETWYVLPITRTCTPT